MFDFDVETEVSKETKMIPSEMNDELCLDINQIFTVEHIAELRSMVHSIAELEMEESSNASLSGSNA